MKKTTISLVSVTVFACGAFIGVSNHTQAAEKELRPIQQAMQARAGWMKAIYANLADNKYDDVQKDAQALASQTSAAAENASDPLAKKLTLKISSLAAETAQAAGMKDVTAIKSKLADITTTCSTCHAKFRK